MRSPFAIFRKHSKVLLVFLTGLAMMCFIFLDSQMRPESAIPMLVVVCTAAAFWLFGRQSGKGMEYAIAGVVAGVLIAYVAPRFFAPSDAVVVTTAGELSQRDLMNLINRRHQANRFLMEAFYRANPDARFRQPPQFGFGDTQTQQGLERDVVFAYLLRKEAEKMGLTITDDVVGQYIKDITGGKLYRDAFREIRRSMNLSEKDLFDVLRDELTAQTVASLQAPRKVSTPDALWDYYRRMHVREKLELVALPVDAFLDQVPEPSQAELVAYFDAHKEYYPNQLEPGAAGFRQPRKYNVGYLKADYAAAEKEVELKNPVTDADIEAFYNENKELYRNRPFPSEQPGAETLAPELPQSGPALSPTEPTESESPAEKPAEEKAAPDAASEPEKAPEELPAEGAPAGETPESEGESKTESPAEPAAPSGEPQSAVERKIPVRLASYQPSSEQPAEAAAPQEPSKTADGPAAAEPSAPAAGADEKKAPAESAAPATEAGASAESKAPADSQGTSEPAPTGEAAPEGTAAAEGSTAPAGEEVPEYKPLDDELKSQIRAQLLRERATAALRSEMETAIGKMYSLGAQHHPTLMPSEKESPETQRKKLEEAQRAIAEEMTAYAESRGMKYVTTGLMSLGELEESENEIARATEAVDDPQQRAAAQSVLDILAQQNVEILYSPLRAMDPLTGDQYAYWVTEAVEQRVPQLDDPGIREQVVKAWKMEQARPLAKKRAEALAEMAKGPKTMQAALEGQTVTGAEGSSPVTIRETESFSWLRPSSAPPTDLFSRPAPVLSPVSAVDGAGPEFMRTVFEELNDGDVGVAENAERTEVYVVQVKDRTHTNPEDLEALRQAFLQEDFFFFFSPYVQLANQEQLEANYRWRLSLEQKYQVAFLQPAARSASN